MINKHKIRSIEENIYFLKLSYQHTIYKSLQHERVHVELVQFGRINQKFAKYIIIHKLIYQPSFRRGILLYNWKYRKCYVCWKLSFLISTKKWWKLLYLKRFSIRKSQRNFASSEKRSLTDEFSKNQPKFENRFQVFFIFIFFVKEFSALWVDQICPRFWQFESAWIDNARKTFSASRKGALINLMIAEAGIKQTKWRRQASLWQLAEDFGNV